MIITRLIPANAIYRNGGLINGLPPLVPDDIYETGNYTVMSCEPIVGMDAFEVTYEFEGAS